MPGQDTREPGPVNGFLRWITSVKVAIALIAWLALGSIAATLVPGWGTGFFSSPAFLAPAVAFFVNLAACSVRRFVRELRRQGRRRHGPDVLHLGLMILVVGAVVSFQGKRTGAVSLAPGDSATLPDDSTLTVTAFRFDRYADGRPKDWVSTLRIDAGGRTVLDGFELRVNRPLRRSGYSYYQSSYGEAWRLVLRGDAGFEQTLHEGEQAEIGGTVVRFMAGEGADDPGGARAVVRVGEGEGAGVRRVAAGGPIAPSIEVVDVRSVSTTVIEVVADPGWPVVAAALALIALGTAITFLQKLREAS